MRKLSQEEFIKRAKKVHGDKYDYSKVEYINSRTKVCIICPEHGEFWQTPNSHLQGQKCSNCAKREQAKKHTTSKEELLSRFKKIHGDKYEYDLIGNEKQRDCIYIKCKKHNYIFKQSILHHLNGSGCPICFSGRKMTTKEFIIKAKDIHGEHYDYSKVDYKGKNIPVEIICPIHGSFWQKPHNHINGGGCPSCKWSRRQERLFYKLKETFPEEKWIAEYNSDWLDKYRIDIFNERIKLAIEYNGEQHYKPVEVFSGKIEYEKCKERDQKKAKLLEEHGCKLYIIPYWEYNLEEVINKVKTFLNYDD